jgi:hypothetical protein
LLLTTTFQFAIFKGIGILIKPTIEWWQCITSLFSVAGVLTVSGFMGYISLRRGKLIDLIKQ